MFQLKTLIFLCLCSYHINGQEEDAFYPISFDTCGQTKGCWQSSESCRPSSCDYAVTWRTVNEDNQDYVEIEMTGKLPSKEGYIALGFSEDMYIGNDGVVACLRDPYGSNKVQVKVAYNNDDGLTNKYLDKTEFGDGFIQPKSDSGKSYGEFVEGNNRIQCRFRRLVSPKKSVTRLKDLSNSKYYMLLFRGKTTTSDGLARPSDDVDVSKSLAIPKAFPSSLEASGAHGSPLAKAHGSLMVIAWVLCASVGIIMSRYYKDMWPNSGLLGERIWFQTHRILQSICVCLTILGFILIFVYCGGYSQVKTYPFYIHPILGIIVTILTVLNPLIALCRCRPGHKDRPYFNWIHFFVGTFAYVLSVPTMILGFRMSGAGLLLRSMDAPLWILIFFVLFQFCVEITLEIHGCIYYRKNKDKRYNYERELEDYEVRIKGGHTARPREPEPSGRMFKYFMIGLHATVSAIIAVVLVIMIAVN